MDPDEVLVRLIAWAVVTVKDLPSEPADKQAAQDVIDLCRWIERGGMLPNAWRPGGDFAEVVRELAMEAAGTEVGQISDGHRALASYTLEILNGRTR